MQGPSLTIGAVSEQTGLSVHTLRFYEQERLLIEPVGRDSAGRRRYSTRDVRWLRICELLRSTGMPLAEIRRYAEAARRGPQTVGERAAILRQQERRVQDEVRRLQDALAVIAQKVAAYDKRVEDGTADRSWAEDPTC